MTSEYDVKSDSSPTTESSSDSQKERNLEQEKLRENMSLIRHKIAVISGKGGVGKSTVTVNLAMAFAMRGYINQIGVLDADIHGPCVPKMLGVHGQAITGSPIGMFPVQAPYGIKVVSMDFLLSDDDQPIIWRGPIKMRAIQQFLSDIIWGKLEFLFIDLPPGTGDEPLTVMQLIPEMDGVIIVTIPSEVSQIVVKKAVTFARQLGVPIIGIIENMSGFVCPKCGTKVNIFDVGGGQKIASDLSIPFLGRIPIDPEICSSSDKGKPFITRREDSPTMEAFVNIVGSIEQFLDQNQRIQAAASQFSKKEDFGK